MFSGAGTIIVKYNNVSLNYSIVDDNDHVIMQSSGTSKQGMLRDIKKYLANLGVVFYDEIRNNPNNKKGNYE